jgi:hypothetical protein
MLKEPKGAEAFSVRGKDLVNLMIALMAFGLMIFCPKRDKRTKKEPPTHNHSKKSDAGNIQSMSEPTERIGHHAGDEAHKAAERKYWGRQNWVAGLGLLFSVLTFIVAIAAAYIARLAFLEAKRQANAAESQIRIARDTEERQLRAYLIVRPTKINGIAQGVDGFPESM